MSILTTLDYTNPQFIQEYQGKTIYDNDAKKYYLVTSNGLQERPESEYKTASAQQALISYSQQNGLPPAGKDSFKTSESFRYVKKDSAGYQAAADNNFGMGKTYSDDQYTGKIIGYTTGGKPLYELKDGSTTAQAPSSSVAISDVSGQSSSNSEKAIQDASNSTVTMSLSQEAKNDLMTIRSQRSDLQSLYDDNGNAINPDDPRVAGIPTLQDWWSQYGRFEYPGTSIDGLGSAADIMPGGTVSSMNFDDLPSELRDSEFFKALPDDQKQIVASTYLANMALNDADKAMWVDAIEQAKDLVEPFYAQQLVLAQDEILNGFSDMEQAYQMKSDLIEKNITRIEEDLATGQDRLSIDQQAELTRLKEQYQNQFIQLQDKIGNSGMAFGSRASDLLSLAAKEQRDVNMSSTRNFARRMEDLNTQASRSIEDQQSNQAALEEQRKQELRNMSRSAEELLGTGEFNKLVSSLDSGLQDTVNNIGALGNITGTLEQQKTQDILNTASTLKGAGTLNL